MGYKGIARRMSRLLLLAVPVVVVLAALGGTLYSTLSRSPGVAERSGREPAPPVAAPTPPAPAHRVREGRVLALDEALKALDLVHPSRQMMAEEFAAPTLGGGTFRLSEHRGTVVFVNFWATWCPPCREEMPAMERLWRQQKDNGFVMVAVSVDRDRNAVQPFVTARGFSFAVALDPGMAVADAYGVRALPSSFVIDRQGYLVAMALGARAWDVAAAHSLIEDLGK